MRGDSFIVHVNVLICFYLNEYLYIAIQDACKNRMRTSQPASRTNKQRNLFEFITDVYVYYSVKHTKCKTTQ